MDEEARGAAQRAATRAGAGRLMLVVALGAGAAVARYGPHPDDRAPQAWLLAASCALTWLLGLRPVARHRAGYLLAAGGIVLAVAASWQVGFAYPLAVALVGTTLAHGALVRWSPIPSLPQRRTPIAGLAIAPLLAAMLSWYRHGDPSTFAALALATVLVLEAYARFGAVTHRLDRAVERLAQRISHGITWVLGAGVMVLVIIPIGLVSRLFGYSPIDDGWADATSAWVRVDPRRQRTADRRPARPESIGNLDLEPSPRVRRRGRLRLTVPLVIVAVLALVVVDRRSDDAPSESAAAGSGAPDTFTRPFEKDAAFRDAPWAKDLRTDLLDAWTNLQFNGAVGGWSIRDGSTAYINVRDGERATVAPDSSLGSPLEVWMFGGSAAFGAGQRDDHTIASELVTRAGREGIALRVHNFGVPATVNWQEAMLLLARLKWREPPDLVIFYDGANDLALQDALAAQGKGDSDQPASLVDGQLDQVLRERAKERHLDLPTVAPEPAGPVRTPEQSGARVATRYGKGIEVIRQLCDDAGVPVSIFWQPELQLKQPLSDADRSTLEDINVSDESLDRRQRFSAAARAGLDELGVVDLTSVFDGRTDALYWDSVHTNEAGAALVADAIYAELAPTLAALRADR